MRQVKKPPNSYLHESLKNIDRLSQTVYAYLEIDAKQHNLHVLSKRQEIIIIVDHPILANQLKYQQREILIHLNQALLSEYKTIKIKLSPPSIVKIKKKLETKPLREEISNLLNSVRKDLETD
jgi:hypothetical protein